ncbi:MAG: hypothetical protein KDK39_10705 [Leptospiraceae bacterium]|nr:hypothetical protein [Leptospiraceae bacterium]
MPSKKDKFGKKVRKKLASSLQRMTEPSTPGESANQASSATAATEAATAHQHTPSTNSSPEASASTRAVPAVQSNENSESFIQKPASDQNPVSSDAAQGSLARHLKKQRELREPEWLTVEDEIDLPRDPDPENSRSEREAPALRPSTKIPEKTMPRNRDSIYNVSTDIRLEDYTEDSEEERNIGGVVRLVGGLVLVGIIIWAIWSFSGALFAPEYKLAVSNQEVGEDQVEVLHKQERVVLSSARPVFIRFQWEEGQLQTDYIRILITQSGGQEVAVLGRMAPVTVNYILFAGPLEAGKYDILVEDRSGSVLGKRSFTVR